MKSNSVKQLWATPRLDKIAMAETAAKPGNANENANDSATRRPTAELS